MALIISVFLTEVLHCLPVEILNRQMVLHGWLFSVRICLIWLQNLAVHDDSYQEMIVKFTQHFLFIAAAMNKEGSEGMWDEEDGFYYDLLALA